MTLRELRELLADRPAAEDDAPVVFRRTEECYACREQIPIECDEIEITRDKGIVEIKLFMVRSH